MSPRESLLRAPLVPAAVLASAGIIADRMGLVPAWLFAALLVAGSALTLASRSWPIGLALAVAGAAGLYHHQWLHAFAPDDIGFAVGEEPRLVSLHGRLADEPTSDSPAANDPLRALPAQTRSRCVLRAERLTDGDGSRSVTGRVAMSVMGRPLDARVGDVIDVTGWLSRPEPPGNPGEHDRAAALADQRVRADLFVRNAGDDAVRVTPSDELSVARLMSDVRHAARRHFQSSLPEPLAGTASALLLGDGSALQRVDWDKYIRTGVVHVLAVSGQHLAVLAGFAWVALRIVGVRRRRGAFIVIAGIVLYSLLAGMQPSVLRSAILVVAFGAAIILGRTPRPANTLALAWLAVLAVNPTDIADAGCQFSFLSVAVLWWGVSAWFAQPEPDPLQKLVEASRPAWERCVRSTARIIGVAYVATLVIALALWPLTAWRYHLISPAALVIGPPAVALASVALIAGFVELFAALVAPPLAHFFGAITHWSLAGLTSLVDAAGRMPGSYLYVGSIPVWWLIGFYLVIAAMLWLPAFARRPGWAGAIVASWTVLGLANTLPRPSADGLRVAFLAVGHGGCAVIELPDGRAILFDSGSMSGPDVGRRVIAPYLWHRGIARIDEVFLSHADLDHFNALPALTERFPVGRVSLTPTFAVKPTPGVREVLADLDRRGVAMRIVTAGETWSAGDATLELLHPTADGPSGPENFRCMVIALRHRGRTVLLTGDVDGEGRIRLMARGRRVVDVLMAPHHGGKTANPPELAEWCRPELVIAQQGPRDRTGTVEGMYEGYGCRYWGTWPHGAVTVVSRRDEFFAETYRTGKSISLGHTIAAIAP